MLVILIIAHTTHSIFRFFSFIWNIFTIAAIQWLVDAPYAVVTLVVYKYSTSFHLELMGYPSEDQIEWTFSVSEVTEPQPGFVLFN